MQERISKEDYFRIEALSSSRIKNIIDGKLNKVHITGKNLDLGNAIDCHRLTPEEFDNEIYVFKGEYPKPGIKSIIDDVFEYVNMPIYDNYNKKLEEHKDLIFNVSVTQEYYGNRTKDWKVTKVLNEGTNYWNSLFEAQGKIILSKEDLDTVIRTSESFANHPHTSKWFHLKNDENFVVIPQLILQWTYEGVACKAMMDLVIIDLKNKVIHPIDLKTMEGSTSTFKFSAKKFKYLIQAAWYTLGITESIEQGTFGIPLVDLKNFKIQPFKFIVESTSWQGCPLVYECSKEDMDIGRYGYKGRSDVEILSSDNPRTVCNSYEVAGFERGVELYKWYEEQENYEYQKEIQENNGHLTLNLYT